MAYPLIWLMLMPYLKLRAIFSMLEARTLIFLMGSDVLSSPGGWMLRPSLPITKLEPTEFPVFFSIMIIV